MINIVIPMAGLGSRFVKKGYEKPKPFIDVNGKPMIVRVLENLSYPNAKYIFSEFYFRPGMFFKNLRVYNLKAFIQDGYFFLFNSLKLGNRCVYF